MVRRALIALLQLTWNVRNATTAPLDAVTIVDLDFVQCIFELMFKHVLVHSNILRGDSDAYRSVATVTMMLMAPVVDARMKFATAALCAVTNTTQYIDRSVFILNHVYTLSLQHCHFPHTLLNYRQKYLINKKV